METDMDNPLNRSANQKRLKCIVPGCEITEEDVDPSYPNTKIRMFGFPGSTTQYEKWCKSLKLSVDYVQKVKYPKICSRHFDSDEFTISQHRARLKTTALPVRHHVPPKPPKIDKKTGLLKEARDALKFAVNLKAMNKRSLTKEEAFGKFIAIQLEEITDQDVYIETTYAMQAALKRGIEDYLRGVHDLDQ